MKRRQAIDNDDLESSTVNPGHSPKWKAVDNPYLHRLQRRHFILFDVLPFFGTVLAVALLFYQPIGWTELGLFITMWALTGLGITVGYHRFFTHRTFRAAQPVGVALAILGSMAGQGSLLSWVATHRRHHECSDTPDDPHSPNLRGDSWEGRLHGLLHSHLLWMKRHPYPNVVHYAPDLVRNQTIVRVAQRYYYWVALGLLLPAAIGALVHQSVMGAVLGLLWGGVVRLFVLEHTIWSINSFLHMFGRRDYASREQSRNGPAVLGLVTFGESWHNNHHAFPESPWFGLSWSRPDPGYWLIRLLCALGLAWGLRIPSSRRVSAKRHRIGPRALPTPAAGRNDP